MKKLSIILVLMAATLFAQAQTIQQTYHFGQPTVSERDGYQQIGLQDCLPYGTVGEPTLPWQSVSLILPQGQEAVSINVEFADFVELEGSFNLYPYQRPRPVSSEKEIPFAKKESLYSELKEFTSIAELLPNKNLTLLLPEITIVEKRVQCAEPVQAKNGRRRFKKAWQKTGKAAL